MQPLVSVILVSYNTRKLTAQSIQSVYGSRGLQTGEIETIVIDNNSSDDTVSYLKKNFPEVRSIANQENKGFGAGNNQGAKLARGRYLLLLNTDAFLEPNSLRVMIDLLEDNGELACVGPQLREASGKVQPSAGYFPTPARVMAWMWWLDKLPLVKRLFPMPYHLHDLAWYRQSQSPDWLMGACILLRAEEYRLAGGFDEAIFMYAEEVELSYRLHQVTGKKNYFTSDTSVTHLGSASSKKANASRLVLELRGIEYFYEKHNPSLLWFIRFVLYTGVIIRLILFKFMPGRQGAYVEYRKFFQKNR